MPLQPGTRIGPYEVASLLGAGGMGEVYRARDSALGRDVAIKVLPDAVANDPERLSRFEREAKLLAALSHANIAQVYGLEKQALVMELVPGEDLTARINRGPMPLAEALPIAIQIAQALEAAHERSIVHRDLKPANIKVTDDGAVKVLDFGLAKALGPDGGNSTPEAMNSPTLTAQATAAGIILGTAAYMSPEQARGRDADKRADVWAFGVVFFEMLTGARLFQGETISDTLAAVLRQDLPWASLPAGTPKEIVRLLRRCLERDRKNRLHDIADARIVLEEVVRGGAGEDAPAAAAPAPAKRPWALASALVVVALAIGAAIGRWSAPTPHTTESNSVRLVIPKPPGVIDIDEPTVAPDGSFVVFVGTINSTTRRLYILRINETAPKPIERTDGATLATVSDDGKWVAFQRDKRLEKIAIEGGEPILVANLTHTGGSGMAWVPGGPILFNSTWLTGLSAVSPDGGGTARPISTLDAARGEIGHWFPNALPDGHHALITVWKKATGINDAEIAVLDLDTGKHTILFKGAEGRYLSPGFIVFFRAGAYHAIRFDPQTQKVSGEPVRVLDDAYGNLPEGDSTQAALGAAGTFAYLSGPSVLPRELLWIAEGGKTETLRFPVRQYLAGHLSPEGKRFAVASMDAGRYAIRILNLDDQREDALDLPGLNWDPIWHPDGHHLAFNSLVKGDFDGYWIDLTTGKAPAPLLVTDADDSPTTFLPDGLSLIVRQSQADGQYIQKRMSLNPPGAPVTLIPFPADRVVVSKDAKFIAFQSSRSGNSEIYVQPLDGGSQPRRVSSAGGTVTAWSQNKQELLYLREPEILAVPFTVVNGEFRPGAERVWARIEGSYQEMLEAAADGRVLVEIDRQKTERQLRVIVNWQQELAKKVK